MRAGSSDSILRSGAVWHEHFRPPLGAIAGAELFHRATEASQQRELTCAGRFPGHHERDAVGSAHRSKGLQHELKHPLGCGCRARVVQVHHSASNGVRASASFNPIAAWFVLAIRSISSCSAAFDRFATMSISLAARSLSTRSSNSNAWR